MQIFLWIPYTEVHNCEISQEWTFGVYPNLGSKGAKVISLTRNFIFICQPYKEKND